MTDSAPPPQLIVGPPGHGVAQYAADLAAAIRRIDQPVQILVVPDVAAAAERAQQLDRAHVHVTDRLFGSSPEAAADAVERLCAQTLLTISVHDVPQQSDGTMLHRRVGAYTRFFASARAVVVNSRHEQQLVARFLPGARPPHAIPLGTRVAVAPASAPPESPSALPRDLVVLIGGYIYPGKGHSQAIRSAAAAAAELRAAGEHVGAVVVRAIGGPSAGHEGDVEQLRADAAHLGVEFAVTGYLDDDAFRAHLEKDGIPLAAHEHVSASRSMLDWVEVGRRPLVVASPYALEMEELRPGTILRYEPDDLTRRLVAGWRDPGTTRLTGGQSLAPTLEDAAREYLAWWSVVPW